MLVCGATGAGKKRLEARYLWALYTVSHYYISVTMRLFVSLPTGAVQRLQSLCGFVGQAGWRSGLGSLWTSCLENDTRVLIRAFGFNSKRMRETDARLRSGRTLRTLSLHVVSVGGDPMLSELCNAPEALGERARTTVASAT
jgi:hypothetical protein